MEWRNTLAAIAVVLLTAATTAADEVRYFQQQGVTYQETRRKVQCQVVETKWQCCNQTVYREKIDTELRETTQTRLCPITEYRYESKLVGRWNPFATPYQTCQLVPKTRYEMRTEKVKVPVAVRRLVPETQAVQRPVATCRTETRDVVISCVPVCAATPSSATAASPATGGVAIGGIKRLDRDSSPTMDTAWRASATR